MTDDRFSAEERRWLTVWDARRKDVETGAMTPEQACDWAWKKVLNGINVTRQRIRRSQRPGHDPRRYDNTWVTVAAERAASESDLSPLASRALAYVVGKLEERGHAFDVDRMARTSGVVVLSVNVKHLRDYVPPARAAGGDRAEER